MRKRLKLHHRTGDTIQVGGGLLRVHACRNGRVTLVYEFNEDTKITCAGCESTSADPSHVDREIETTIRPLWPTNS